MTREQKDLVIIKSRPGSPGVGEIGENGIQPWQTDPDLAAMEIARLMINKFPTPSVVSDKFVVRHGIWKALDHRPPIYDQKLIKEIDDAVISGEIQEFSLSYYERIKLATIDPGNPTGLSCRLRVNLYDRVANESVNIDGRLFNSVFAFLMKPKYIIQGQIGQPIEKEEKQSIAGRILGAFTGKKKNPDQQQGQ